LLRGAVFQTAENEMKAGPGRPKGLQNRTTRIAKEAIALAADELGGAERLVAWAKEAPENERAFWVSIYPKLLPLQLTGENGGPLQAAVTYKVVGVEPSGTGT